MPVKMPAENIFCPFLLCAQNHDGGWGYQPGSPSCTEPTCWTLLALIGLSSNEVHGKAIASGCEWLLRTQLSDGSWPPMRGQETGSSVTSLACLVLLQRQVLSDQLTKGVRWISQAWPAEGTMAWRIRRLISREKDPVRQDHSLRGWSWTPGTSSWVVPTSHAVILLRHLPERFQSPLTMRRRRLAEAMLCDRACPGGGWNCGNPVVYGVPGEPQVEPTVWALLALGDSRPEVRAGLDWLGRTYETISGAASLALAHLCLTCYGKPTPPVQPRLMNLHERERFLDNVVTTAWAVMALEAPPCWARTRSDAPENR